MGLFPTPTHREKCFLWTCQLRPIITRHHAVPQKQAGCSQASANISIVSGAESKSDNPQISTHLLYAHQLPFLLKKFCVLTRASESSNLASLVWTWGNWGTKQSSNSPNVTQLVAEPRTQVYVTPKPLFLPQRCFTEQRRSGPRPLHAFSYMAAFPWYQTK